VSWGRRCSVRRSKCEMSGFAKREMSGFAKREMSGFAKREMRNARFRETRNAKCEMRQASGCEGAAKREMRNVRFRETRNAKCEMSSFANSKCPLRNFACETSRDFAGAKPLIQRLFSVTRSVGKLSWRSGQWARRPRHALRIHHSRCQRFRRASKLSYDKRHRSLAF
jgi:hypothetical protein